MRGHLPIVVFFGAMLVILLVTLEARSHQAPSGWSYPLSCCSGTDCNQIPASRVETRPDGYHVNVVPGDHDFITRATLFVIPYDDETVKPSPDGKYHLCISQVYRGEMGDTAPSRVLCFFVPSPGA